MPWRRSANWPPGPVPVLVCSHGDVLKAILADALGIHLDGFQRINVAPASLSVVRYTPVRPIVERINHTATFPRCSPRRGRLPVWIPGPSSWARVMRHWNPVRRHRTPVTRSWAALPADAVRTSRPADGGGGSAG